MAMALPTSTGTTRQRCGSEPRILAMNSACNSPLTNVITKLPLSDVNRQCGTPPRPAGRRTGVAQPGLQPGLQQLRSTHSRWYQIWIRDGNACRAPRPGTATRFELEGSWVAGWMAVTCRARDQIRSATTGPSEQLGQRRQPVPVLPGSPEHHLVRAGAPEVQMRGVLPG